MFIMLPLEGVLLPSAVRGVAVLLMTTPGGNPAPTPEPVPVAAPPPVPPPPLVLLGMEGRGDSGFVTPPPPVVLMTTPGGRLLLPPIPGPCACCVL
jgi:hypothetical protein